MKILPALLQSDIEFKGRSRRTQFFWGATRRADPFLLCVFVTLSTIGCLANATHQGVAGCGFVSRVLHGTDALTCDSPAGTTGLLLELSYDYDDRGNRLEETITCPYQKPDHGV